MIKKCIKYILFPFPFVAFVDAFSMIARTKFLDSVTTVWERLEYLGCMGFGAYI